MSEPSPGGDVNTALARQAFNAGLKHVNKGEFDAAITDFEAALQNKHNPAVLYNLGLAYAAAGFPIKAIATLQSYITEAGTTLPATRLDTVSALIETQRKLLGEIKITNTEPGIVVSVDGVQLGTTPLAPLSVVRGSHALLAERDGFKPVILSVQVEATQTREVQLQFVESPPLEPVLVRDEKVLAPVEPPSPPRALEPRATPPLPVPVPGRTVKQLGVASLGIALASAGFGTYFGLSTRASWAERERHCNSGVCDERAVEAWRDAKRSAFAADLLFASALVTGGLGAYLLIVQSRDTTQPTVRVGLVSQSGAWQVQWTEAL